MIFCSKCYKCEERSALERDVGYAKMWWRKYHVRYIFSCGAYYHPENGYFEVRAGRSCLLNLEKT